MANVENARGKLELIGALLFIVLNPVSYGQQAPGPGQVSGTGASKPNSASTPPDKVVLKVGNTQVTAGEFDFLSSRVSKQIQKSMITQGRRPLGDQYALMLVLSQEALNQHLDAAPAFRLQQLQLLAEAEYQKLAQQVVVKTEEIAKYFADHRLEFEEAKLYQVTVRVRPQGAKEDYPGLTLEEARARAGDIRKAFASGADAKKIAQDFKDPKNVQIDSEPRPVRHGYLPPDFEKVVFALKEGELTQLLENAQGVFLFQMIQHQVLGQEEAKSQIENTLRQQKVEADVLGLKKIIPVWMDEEYFAPPSTTSPAPRAAPPSGKPPSQP